MGGDSSYGSGAVRSASSSASRANATRAAANRKKSGKRTAAARATVTNNIRNAPNDTPFKGTDPFSVTARALWGTSGRVADAVTGRRTLDSNQQAEVVATFAGAALAGAGIYAGTRRSAPARIRGPTGAVPMTTAQRSAAVTRAGRAGVGSIGPSIKPKAPDTSDYWNATSYDSAYSRAESIYRQKYGKPSPAEFVPGYERGVPLDRTYWSGGRSDISPLKMGVYSQSALLKTAITRNAQGPIRKITSRKDRNR